MPSRTPNAANRSADAAARRREAALARLAARRMPLPGQPAPLGQPAPTHPQHPATVRRPFDDARARGAMRLVGRSDTSDRRPIAAPNPTPASDSSPSASATATRRRPGLTEREIQVLRTWLLTDSKIVVAEELSISIGTVNTHLTRIRAKYTAVDRTARTKASLAARAIQDGIISLDEL
ncbi:MAG: helix-turn-helix transcriptional regulator [Actinomycetota bacterium]|nr:helix-turn-helix transcriptional regulator [Actinomycetota bacterium]